MSEFCLILTVDPGECTKLLSLRDEEIGRLFRLLLTHTLPHPSVTAICLKSLSQCSDTSLECSLTKIRLSSTRPQALDRLFEQPKVEEPNTSSDSN